MDISFLSVHREIACDDLLQSMKYCDVGYVRSSFYRTMHFSAKRGIAIVILYVCLSVTFVSLD